MKCTEKHSRAQVEPKKEDTGQSGDIGLNLQDKKEMSGWETCSKCGKHGSRAPRLVWKKGEYPIQHMLLIKNWMAWVLGQAGRHFFCQPEHKYGEESEYYTLMGKQTNTLITKPS